MVGVRERAAERGQAEAMDQVLGLQREGQEMTADPWDGPACAACEGRGEIVYVRGSYWVGAECAECHGTGLAGAEAEVRYREDGYRIPQDGEVYDPEIHGPIPTSRWGRSAQ